MIDQNIQITPLADDQPTPLELLELADPSREQVKSYLTSGSCYIARSGSETIGVLVIDEIDSAAAEIKNIAVREAHQGKGLGKALLRYAEEVSRERGYQSLLIGTGNSSVDQLALYQKMGFELQSIKKNFFLNHYPEPIYENGIQCKHMVMLEKRF